MKSTASSVSSLKGVQQALWRWEGGGVCKGGDRHRKFAFLRFSPRPPLLEQFLDTCLTVLFRSIMYCNYCCLQYCAMMLPAVLRYATAQYWSHLPPMRCQSHHPGRCMYITHYHGPRRCLPEECLLFFSSRRLRLQTTTGERCRERKCQSGN